MKAELEQVVLPSISLPPSNNSLSYNIYLIDIHKMVKYGDVKCVKKNMYDQELNYLCVSYRHGREETQEWEVNTPDYVAYINTFRKDDLKTLCECIRKEPDLKHITYIWIDAISIDQNNKKKMYETIQQKELIFDYASYILAVPDLHWYYLRSKNQLQDNIITHVWKYAKHIYQEINHGKKKKKKKINTDIHWDDLNYQLMITWIYLYLHPQEHATFQFSSLLHQLSLIDQDLVPLLQWDDDFVSFYKLFKNALAIMTMKDDDNNSQPFYFKEKKWYQQFYYENYYYPLKPASSSSTSSLLLSMDSQQKLQQPQWKMYYNSIGQQMHLDFNNIDLLKKQLFIWKKKWEQCQKDLKEAIQFLHNITDEWLNRTWVISEYLLARKKKTPIKLVYLSLLWNLRYEQEEHYHSFFTLLNGNDVSDDQSKSTFLTQIERKLSLKRDYLDIILNSNATNPLDRFISILPLWDKYKHVLLYNNNSNNNSHNSDSNDLHSTLTIAPFLDWKNIATMEALRLKLYEILDLDDKLRLLHACSYNIKIRPSFSTGYQEQWLFTEKLHQDQFQQIKGLYFIPELEITIIDDNEIDQDQHNNKISCNNLGSNKYEIEENKDHTKWKINEQTSHTSPSSTMISKEKNDTSSSPSSSPIPLSATPLPFTKNITTIELGSDNDQLKIECDLYYEINYYHHPSGKRYPHEKFNAEFVIIPLYQKTDQQKNNRCFIPLWKKKTESLWEVYRMDSLYYSTGHYYFFKMSVGVLKNGIKEDGCFIVK